jgi:hypothetical protein
MLRTVDMFGCRVVDVKRKGENYEPVHVCATQVQCCQDLQREQVARLVADVRLLCVETRRGRVHAWPM